MHDNTRSTKLADMDFVHQLMQAPLLDKESEYELACAWKDNRDEAAFQKLVQSFTRLVVSVALRFRFYGIPFSDLVQEGILGLIYAAERFEPDREVRFSTYAKWWIRATIQDFVLRNWSIVRTGSTTAQKQLFFNLKRLKSHLSNFSTDALNDEDRKNIADTLNVTLSDVEDMEKRLNFSDLSLSMSVGESSSANWQEFLPDERQDQASQMEDDDSASWREFWLDHALNTLEPREKEVIQSHRLQDPPQTLEEIGKRYNLSKERVRQIEMRALRKMKHALVAHIQEVKDLF